MTDAEIIAILDAQRNPDVLLTEKKFKQRWRKFNRKDPYPDDWFARTVKGKFTRFVKIIDGQA